MTLMEKIQKDCKEGSDIWITGMEKDGLHPFQHLVRLQEIVKGIGRAMQEEPDTQMVAVPAGVFAEMATLSNVGKHVVVIRLLERGIVSEDEIHLGSCEDCPKGGDCDAAEQV